MTKVSPLVFLVVCVCTLSVKATHLDKFGVKKLFESADVEDGDFYSNFGEISREFESVNVDPNNPDCYARGSNSDFFVNSSNGVLSITGSSPRYYCYLNHTNVELTTYGRRGSEISPSSTQGLVMVGRSNHKDYKEDFCQARSYYMRLYNAGYLCFLKEYIHNDEVDEFGRNSQCLVYASGNPCVDVFDEETQSGVWYGMKMIIQNGVDSVNLLGYLDIVSGDKYADLFDNYPNATGLDGYDGFDGGNWTLYLNFTDYGDNWQAYYFGNETKCMDICGYTGSEYWSEQGNSVFLRASNIMDYQYKWFSKREIVPFSMVSHIDNGETNTDVDDLSFSSTEENVNNQTEAEGDSDGSATPDCWFAALLVLIGHLLIILESIAEELDCKCGFLKT